MCEKSEVESSDEVVDPLVGLREMAIQIVKGVLPYPDVLQRWRVRRQARGLIRFAPWPGNDATPLHLAQLCLVRSLALQRQVHRAVRWRQPEAAALLARSSVENTILGLWCLYANEPMERLRGSVGQVTKGVFRYLAEGDIWKSKLIDLLVEEIGGSGSLPTIYDMADTVRKEIEADLTTDLYKRIYAPLSSFFSHANGLVLMRHIKSNGSPRYRPSYPWHRRGPVRVADACLGVMALAVSVRLEEPSGVAGLFANYADAHMSRSLAPLPVMAGRGIRRSFKWRRVPIAIERFRDGVRYYHSAKGKSDPWETREERVRSDITKIMSVLEPDEPTNVFPKMVDILVTMLVGERPGSPQTNEDADM
jgi:hypothetical protein